MQGFPTGIPDLAGIVRIHSDASARPGIGDFGACTLPFSW